jgi:hypothetical protein
MKRLAPLSLVNWLLIALLVVCPCIAQTNQAGRQASAPPIQTAPRSSLGFGLAEDTPIRLRLNRAVSSKDAKVGDRVDFQVLEDVKAGDVVVIRQGATALATVTEAHSKRSFGRSGKLNVNIDSVQLVNGDRIPLRAVKGGSGGNHVGAMTGAVVATSLIFFPAAPLFFFIKGKNITIPQGTEITAYVAGDTPLNIANFTSAPPVVATEASNKVSSDTATVVVKSTPEAAEIIVDGKFMGSTMSTLQLTPGDHTIRIEKSGHKTWERIMTVNVGGNINIDARLEKLP